jgi:hypothetical protein
VLNVACRFRKLANEVNIHYDREVQLQQRQDGK